MIFEQAVAFLCNHDPDSPIYQAARVMLDRVNELEEAERKRSYNEVMCNNYLPADYIP